MEGSLVTFVGYECPDMVKMTLAYNSVCKLPPSLMLHMCRIVISSLSLSFSHTIPLSLFPLLSHINKHTLSNTHTHKHTHSLSLPHSHTHTYTPTHTTFLSLTHTHTHKHTHTHTHTLSLCLSFSHSLLAL